VRGSQPCEARTRGVTPARRDGAVQCTRSYRHKHMHTRAACTRGGGRIQGCQWAMQRPAGFAALQSPPFVSNVPCVLNLRAILPNFTPLTTREAQLRRGLAGVGCYSVQLCRAGSFGACCSSTSCRSEAASARSPPPLTRLPWGAEHAAASVHCTARAWTCRSAPPLQRPGPLRVERDGGRVSQAD
jgi:hypothetical protein